MRAPIIIVSAIILAACGQPDTGSEAEPFAAISAPSEQPNKWTAIPFEPDRDTAEVNDLRLFFEHFKKNSDTLYKGEFETTEEHAARIATEEAFGRFFNDRPYAITTAEGSQLRYSADNEVFYTLTDRLCTYFDFPYTIDKDNQTACVIGRELEGVGRYYGNSVSGTAVEMAQSAEIRFHFVLPVSSSGIVKSTSVPGAYHLKGVCPVERSKAEALSGKLGFAYLVTLNKPSIVGGPRNFEGPSSRPSKVTFYEGLDVDLAGYICYELGSSRIVNKVLY